MKVRGLGLFSLYNVVQFTFGFLLPAKAKLDLGNRVNEMNGFVRSIIGRLHEKFTFFQQVYGDTKKASGSSKSRNRGEGHKTEF